MLYRIQNIATGEFFILSKDGALTSDFNSTLFNAQADLLGSYSYPGAMPLDPNRAKIKNAHYVPTDTSLRTLDAMMWLGPLPFKQVKLNFTIENQVISYNLYYDTALISNQLKTLKLNQLSQDGVSDQYNAESFAGLKTYMRTVALAEPGVYPYTFFPWKNDGAYNDSAYATYLQSPGGGLAVDVKFQFTDHKLYRVTIATTSGMTPLTDPDHYIVENGDIWFPVSKIINRWELDSLGNGYFNVDPDFPISQTQTPAFYLVYVLKRIARFFGFEPIGQILTDPDFMRKVIWSNIPIGPPIIPDFWLLMPDILLTDFFKEIRTRFGLLIDFDVTRKLAIFESLKNLETTDEVCDLQELEVLSYRETGTQSQAFTISETPDDKDTAFTETERNNPTTLVIGSPATAVQTTDIPLASVATKMITEQSAVDITALAPIITNWRIPWIKMPVDGNSPLDQVSTLAHGDRNAFKLRFLDYHGMQQDDSGYLYPYASSDELDESGTVISDDTLSLTPVGTTYNAVKDYYEFLKNSKPSEWIFEMWPKDFTKLISNRRIITRDPYNRSSAIHSLMSQNSTDFINNKEKVVAKLTLYPIVRPDNLAEVIPTPPVTPPEPPFDNGPVFLRPNTRNLTDFDVTVPTPAFGQRADIFAEFFADFAGTTPKNVTTLSVRFKVTQIIDGDVGHPVISYDTIVCTSTTDETELAHQAPLNTTTGGHLYEWTYQVMPSAHYTIID